LFHYGQALPDFVLKDEMGKLWRLSEVCPHSRLTLIMGFALGQDVSIRQLVAFREMLSILKAKGLSVVALGDTTLEEARNLKRQYALNYPVLSDPNGKVMDLLHASELPFSLLLDPKRQVVFVNRGYQHRLLENQTVWKAFVELTGQAPVWKFEFGQPALPSPSKDRPLVLNDLQGDPVSLPMKEPMAAISFSSNCPACPKEYQAVERVWETIPPKDRRGLIVVMADTPSVAGKWLTGDRRKGLAGAKFWCDPAMLTRRKLGLPTFGGVALMDEGGRVLDRVNAGSGPAYERGLERVLTQ
jgi:peroxiredoxin